MDEPLKFEQHLYIRALFGEKIFEPVQYKVISKVEGPWWWKQTLYYVESDIGTFLGPFDNNEEAQATAYRMRSYG